MRKVANFKVKGLKCDNPDCDFRDDTINAEDYEKWLNVPCPKCGSNLFTQKDYNALIGMMKIVKFVNIIMFPIMFIFGRWLKRKKYVGKMDGTGDITMEEVK